MNHNMDVKLQVGVKALLKNKDGQYLMLRRSLEKYPDIKGRWDIVGGRIDPGSVLIDNLKREIKEETDLELVGQPRLIAAQDIIPKPEIHVIRLTYIGEVAGDIKLDESENDQYKWHTIEELKQITDLDIYFKELLDNNQINV
jgi:ADP-ribose pyrophosphatase YjhB (NUDIX family)